MLYEPMSDRAMASERKRRQREKAIAVGKLKAKAERLGYSLVKKPKASD